MGRTLLVFVFGGAFGFALGGIYFDGDERPARSPNRSNERPGTPIASDPKKDDRPFAGRQLERPNDTPADLGTRADEPTDLEAALGRVDWRESVRMIGAGAQHTLDRTAPSRDANEMAAMAKWLAEIAPVLNQLETNRVRDMLALPAVQIRMMAASLAQEAGLSAEDERALRDSFLPLVPDAGSARNVLVESEATMAVYDRAIRESSRFKVDPVPKLARDYLLMAKDEARIPPEFLKLGQLPQRYLGLWQQLNGWAVPADRGDEARRVFDAWITEGTRVASSFTAEFGTEGAAALAGRWRGDELDLSKLSRARLELRVRMARLQVLYEPKLLAVLTEAQRQKAAKEPTRARVRMFVWGPF